MTKFETETCSRCQGTGEYSFCLSYGRRCFKCAGSKVVYTKKGKAALDYLNILLTKKVKDVQIGDRIRVISFTNGGQEYRYFAPITRIEDGGRATSNGKDYQMVSLITSHSKFGESGLSISPDANIIVKSADYTDLVKKALEYQDTLTKMGKPKKRVKVNSQNADKQSATG